MTGLGSMTGDNRQAVLALPSLRSPLDVTGSLQAAERVRVLLIVQPTGIAERSIHSLSRAGISALPRGRALAQDLSHAGKDFRVMSHSQVTSANFETSAGYIRFLEAVLPCRYAVRF